MRYKIGFKYKDDPWILFQSKTGSAKFGGGEDVIVQSDDLDVMKCSKERIQYHACGMSTVDIIQMY